MVKLSIPVPPHVQVDLGFPNEIFDSTTARQALHNSRGTSWHVFQVCRSGPSDVMIRGPKAPPGPAQSVNSLSNECPSESENVMLNFGSSRSLNFWSRKKLSRLPTSMLPGPVFSATGSSTVSSLSGWIAFICTGATNCNSGHEKLPVLILKPLRFPILRNVPLSRFPPVPGIHSKTISGRCSHICLRSSPLPRSIIRWTNSIADRRDSAFVSVASLPEAESFSAFNGFKGRRVGLAADVTVFGPSDCGMRSAVLGFDADERRR